MAKVKFEDGTVINFDGDPSQQDIDEAYSQVKGGGNVSRETNPLFEGVQLSQPVPEQQESPVSLIDRARYGFGNEEGMIADLKTKFPIVTKDEQSGAVLVGSNPRNLTPVDPDGFFNDFMGELADAVGMVPVIASQIAGAALGSAGGPAGTIVGGGLGAGVGEGIKQGFGESMGVYKAKVEEKVTDALISTAFGASGEALGQALKVGGQVIKPQIAKLMDRGVQASANPNRTLQAIAKGFKVTAGVDEKDVVEAGMYGFNNTLNAPYTKEGYLDKIATDFIEGVIKHNEYLGEQVAAGDKWALSKFGNKKLELRPLGTELLNALSSDRIGLVDKATHTLNRGAFTEAKDYKSVKQLFDLFFKQNPNGELLPRNLSFAQVLDYRKRADSGLRGYFNSIAKNPQAENAITEYISGLRGMLAETTVPKGMKLTEDLVEKSPYLRANRVFSEWKKDIDLLKANGLNISDVSDLSDMFRSGTVVSSKLDSFMKNLQNKSSSAHKAFQIIADKIPVKYPGKGLGGAAGTVYDELRKYSAAQGFVKTNPNFLRLQSIATMAGLGFLVDRKTPAGLGVGTGLGLLLGTPAGASAVLKGGEALFRNAPRSLGQTFRKNIKGLPGKRTERYGAAVLSRLLESVARKDAANSPSQNGQK